MKNSQEVFSVDALKMYNIKESNKSTLLFDNLIWGIDEVCAYSGYAKGTIYNLVSKGEVPHRTRGRKRKLVFVPSEIVAWLKGEL
jgi:predicted DNA-binding transcriptional regulator AlpA